MKQSGKSLLIYKDEYLKRYATVQTVSDFAMLPVQQLQEDIQRDFLDFHYFLYGDLKEGVPSDFLHFLNRLLIDYPYVFSDKTAKKRVISILKNSCLEGKERYIHLLSNQADNTLASFLSGNYLSGGFNIKDVDKVYFDALITEIAFSNNIEDYISHIPVHLMYTESFIEALSKYVEVITTPKKVWVRQKQNLLALFSFMQEHINDIQLVDSQKILLKTTDLLKQILSCYGYYENVFMAKLNFAYDVNRLLVVQYLLGKIDQEDLINKVVQKKLHQFIDEINSDVVKEFMDTGSELRGLQVVHGLLDIFGYNNMIMKPIVDNFLDAIEDKECEEEEVNNCFKKIVNENKEQLLESDKQERKCAFYKIMLSIDKLYIQCPRMFFDETIAAQVQKIVKQFYLEVGKKERKKAKQILKQLKQVTVIH